jgi:hypothetical protein
VFSVAQENLNWGEFHLSALVTWGDKIIFVLISVIRVKTNFGIPRHQVSPPQSTPRRGGRNNDDDNDRFFDFKSLGDS